MAARRRRKAFQSDKPRRLKAWSYSTYSNYERCPRRVYYAKIERLPDPIGKAGQRGIHAHEQAEQYVLGQLDELPKILRQFPAEFDELRAHPRVETEGEWAFTRTWETTDWRDWSGAWVRVKLDAAVREGDVLRVIDYKTGMVRNYDAQVELYALAGFLRHPAVKRVEAELWYLDQGEIDGPYGFKKAEVDELRKVWEERVAPMMTDETFEPTPHPAVCRYCPFSKKKGGPCEAAAA